jgi:hypothetical protein
MQWNRIRRAELSRFLKPQPTPLIFPTSRLYPELGQFAQTGFEAEIGKEPRRVFVKGALL